MQIAWLFIGLAILMALAIFGVPIFIATLFTAIVMAIVQGMGVYDSMINLYAAGFGGFAGGYILMFAFGTIFGKLVEISGAADSIAITIVHKFGKKYVIPGLVVATAIMTMGGISVFVSMFTLYALALPLFREANIPRRFFPGIMSAGATWACCAPFSPSITNVLPARYFGTDLGAIPVQGTISSLALVVVSTFVAMYVIKKAQEKGDSFQMPEGEIYKPKEDRPPFIISVIPMIFLLITLNVFKVEVEMTLLWTCILCVVLYWKWLRVFTIKQFFAHMTASLQSSAISLSNTAATIGFGKVIASTPGFEKLTEVIGGMNISPILGVVVLTSILVMASGSQSGGLGVVCPILDKMYSGVVSNEVLHRLSCFASNGLDTLPHNGWVVTILGLIKCSYKEAYPLLFINSVFLPLLIQTGGGILLMAITGVF